MIWRTSKTATVRSRWVGPGVVILQNGHTVYVAVRSRLWKCNVDSGQQTRWRSWVCRWFNPDSIRVYFNRCNNDNVMEQ